MSKKNPLHLEAVASDAERTRRRRLYIVLGFQGIWVSVLLLFASVFHFLPGVIACLVIIILTNFYLLWTATQLSGMQWSMRQRLRKSGYKICPQCSYDLSASPLEGICPECGFAYSPQILKERWESAYQRMLAKSGR
ncbi:MAG: hypothetical protein NTV94_19445 [Planctomycetota bacterium]|nr:hypothetical protein [Planctomycetota bacterium]